MFTFLRRLMVMWYTRYKDEPSFDPSTHAHMPNIAKESGLKDVMAIGNLLELGTVLDRRSYGAARLHSGERPEMGSCQWMYRKLQSLFAQRYTVAVGRKSMHPLTIFCRSLVEFAAAVVVYKEDMEGTVLKVPGCSAVRVREKTKSFFRQNYPELLPRLDELIAAHTEYLYWTGPKIVVQQCNVQSCFYRQKRLNTAMMTKKAPHREFLDSPLYPDPIQTETADEEPAPDNDENGKKAPDADMEETPGRPTSPKVKGKGKGKGTTSHRLPSSSAGEDRPAKRLRTKD
jgi:hypothetical protein